MLLIVAVFGYVHFYRNTQAPAAPAPSVTVVTPPKPPVALSTEPEDPSELYIEKIGVSANIIALGLTADGAMEAPHNLAEVGWYNQSSRVGESKYSVLLDGHHGLGADTGVFERLGELVEGDEIIIQTAQENRMRYVIVETETLPYGDVDMHKALMPYKEGMQSLTIITCEGNYIENEATYDNRTVVYAERVE